MEKWPRRYAVTAIKHTRETQVLWRIDEIRIGKTMSKTLKVSDWNSTLSTGKG